MGYFLGYMSSDERIIEQDDDNKYVDDQVQFEYQVVESERDLPFHYENEKYRVVFSGRIYNDLALRNKLKKNGYTFKTECNAELIAGLYDDQQEAMLTELRGMFSFLIWDKEELALFGARDPFGIKSFYYLEKDGGLFCSSEMRSLMEIENTKEVNVEALHYYFSFQYVPEPNTIQNGIQKLAAGHFLIKKPRGLLRIEAYQTLGFNPGIKPFEVKIKQIREALRASVHLQMQSDDRVGAFLSGGIDSSAIVALAKEINPSIKTFTVGFEHDGFSEIEIAKKTAEQLDVENIHYIIRPEEFIEELPHVIKQFAEPIADPVAVPLYIASREARKEVDVILSGEGADELFGGYMIYREPNDLKLFNYIPDRLKKMLHFLSMLLPEGMYGKSFLERGTLSLEERYIGNAKIFTEIEKGRLLRKFEHTFCHKQITKPLYDLILHYPAVHKMQYIDLHTWLRGDILRNAESMTMAHGLELRVPFLDRAVYQVTSELLPIETVTNGTTKYALREALRGIVPHPVLYNKKLGFPVPIRHWLKNELYDWAKTIIKSSPTDHLIHQKYVLELLEKHRHGKIDYSRRIWTVLVFMIWYRDVFVG